MQLLETAFRIRFVGRLIVVPALFRLQENSDGTLVLQDADVEIAGHRVSWTARIGHLFDSRDRAELAGSRELEIELCDERRIWRAAVIERPDGMETVVLEDEAGRLDLADSSFEVILSETQRRAIELTAEAIGRRAPSIL